MTEPSRVAIAIDEASEALNIVAGMLAGPEGLRPGRYEVVARLNAIIAGLAKAASEECGGRDESWSEAR